MFIARSERFRWLMENNNIDEKAIIRAILHSTLMSNRATEASFRKALALQFLLAFKTTMQSINII